MKIILTIFLLFVEFSFLSCSHVIPNYSHLLWEGNEAHLTSSFMLTDLSVDDYPRKTSLAGKDWAYFEFPLYLSYSINKKLYHISPSISLFGAGIKISNRNITSFYFGIPFYGLKPILSLQNSFKLKGFSKSFLATTYAFSYAPFSTVNSDFINCLDYDKLKYYVFHAISLELVTRIVDFSLFSQFTTYNPFDITYGFRMNFYFKKYTAPSWGKKISAQNEIWNVYAVEHGFVSAGKSSPCCDTAEETAPQPACKPCGQSLRESR
ncbi:MAG: hypothetical protein JW863_21800 [Chitinispirillaceae bacterium]|nr:hypothetical protein [Chitinispirillaceae bacterium]